MASVNYCFNICRSIDKKLTNDRHPTPTNISTNIPNNTGTLIFGRRFSLSNIKFVSQEQNDLSSDQN
jgi:hypothetical protein